MKQLSASRFRLVLSVIMLLVIAAIIAIFIIGYGLVQNSAREVAVRTADAEASRNTITSLQTLEKKLEDFSLVRQKLTILHSTSNLPQFDAEHSVRTICDQLGIGISNLTFVDTTAATSGTTAAAATPAAAKTGKADTISFELSGPISYSRFMDLLSALETSAPKLILSGITLPEDSTTASVNPGPLTVRIATL